MNNLSIYGNQINQKFDKILLHEGKVIGLFKKLFDHSHEKKVTNVLKKLIKPGWYVVDCGALIGYHTLTMSKLAERVYAYEMNEANLSFLRKNIVGKRNINIIPFVVSEVAGVLNFDFNAGDDFVRCPLSTNSRDAYYLKKVIKLDDQVSKCNFLRIDIPGKEWEIIKGASELILKHHPIILLERRKDSIIELLHVLSKEGYSFFGIRNNGRLKRLKGNTNESIVAIYQ